MVIANYFNTKLKSLIFSNHAIHSVIHGVNPSMIPTVIPSVTHNIFKLKFIV